MRAFVEEYIGRRIHVIGVAGIEGFAMARFWLDQGATDLVLHDALDPAALRQAFCDLHLYLPAAERLGVIDQLLTASLQLRLGEDYLSDIGPEDVICLSQNWFAYPSNDPLIPLLKTPQRTVLGLVDHYLATFPGRVIGVTGSNGKSTTVDLITRMLEADGQRVFYGGNERIKTQGLLQIATATAADYLVLEISNRQLRLGLRQSPQIAVITNVTPNHLGEHGSFEAYAEVKRSIAAFQVTGDYLVLNADDPVSGHWAAPQGLLTTSQNLDSTEVGIAGDQIVIRASGQETKVFPVAALPQPGEHFVSNVLLAIGVAKLAGVQPRAMANALTNYSGLPGRLERVGSRGGTRFYYDVKSTVPQATVAALRAFDQGERIILIAGGEVKGMSYQAMADEITKRVQTLILLPGTVRSELLPLLPSTLDLLLAPDMEAAWAQVCTTLESADVVLLSPGGAFFYSHFLAEDIGFKERVNRIAS